MTTQQISLSARSAGRNRSVAASPQHVVFAVSDRPEPWLRRHVTGTLLLALLGIVGMVVCWYVGAGKLTYQDQVPWLVGSIFSAGVVVLAGVYWLVGVFRQVTLLERDVAGYLVPWMAQARASMEGVAVVGEEGTLVIGPGMRSAHRPHCLLARGKADLTPMSSAEADRRGLPGCGACGA